MASPWVYRSTFDLQSVIGCWCGIDLARVGFRPSRLIAALQQRAPAQVKSCQIMLVTVVKDEKIKVEFKLKGSGNYVGHLFTFP